MKKLHDLVRDGVWVGSNTLFMTNIFQLNLRKMPNMDIFDILSRDLTMKAVHFPLCVTCHNVKTQLKKS